MMKKIMLLVVVLLTTSCIVNHPTEIGEQEGSDGVKINFMEGYPPSKIYENNAVEAILELKNKGSYAEPYGKVVLYGYDNSVVSFEGEFENSNYVEKELPKLKPKTKYLPDGGYDTLEFKALEQNVMVENGEKYTTDIFANVCYHYKTTASPSICVVEPGQGDKACRARSVSMQSQAAPVAVTEVKPQTVSGKLDVVATVENVGGGRLIAPKDQSYERCPFNLEEEDFDEVVVNMSINNLPSPECRGGLVSLQNGQGEAHCTFDVEDVDKSGYTTQINIVVDYYYTDKTSKRIEIMNLKP